MPLVNFGYESLFFDKIGGKRKQINKKYPGNANTGMLNQKCRFFSGRKETMIRMKILEKAALNNIERCIYFSILYFSLLD